MYTSISSLFSHIILKLFYMCKLKTAINLFFSLIWMSLVIYYLLGKLLDTDHHQVKQISRDIYFDGEPSSLMAEIGFVGNAKYYPQSYQDENDLPIFVLPLGPKDMQGLFAFLFSFRRHYSDKKLVIYNLGLSKDQYTMVQKHCRCLIREVRWSRYPKHVHNLALKAYLPLIIQETLQEFGAVFYCTVNMRFNSTRLDPEVTTQAFMYGLVSWSPHSYPTSTFTHYNMFRFFNTSHENFYFHRMVDPNHAVYFNTRDLHSKLMLPWVKCALDYDCVSPLGAQPQGCSMQHKPKFVYAGCHRYDIAAFNVLLGLMFDYETPYIGRVSLFGLEELSSKRQDGK